MNILALLTEQLGISETQAEGGLGLLLKIAQEKLATEEFGQIANLIPNADGLISAAPETSGGLGGLMGGLLSSFGGSLGGNLGDFASLASGFKELDMDAGLITEFLPVVISFLKSEGGDEISSLLDRITQA